MSESDSKFFDVDEKDIFKFTKEFPTGSGEGIPNHFHICVKVEDSYYLFNCCTSQSGKVKDRMEFLGWQYVEITNRKKTLLTERTFVDCDDVFKITKEEFDKYLEEDKITPAGLINNVDYQNIVKGILASDRVEEETKKLFR